MIHKIKQIVAKRAGKEKAAPSIPESVRITNETVAARRDEVLASARKYIYPLQASKHRIVRLSIGLFVAAVIGFFAFCALELYKFQSTSSFIYGVTQVLPFPLAVINNRQIVSYNDYLFELRRYVHYYQTQQHTDFATRAGKQQLAVLKQRSLAAALQDAYVDRLATMHKLTVRDSDVDQAIALVRSQNRLGSNDQVFQSVLNQFWGWSVDDFRRELRQELLAQKVVSALDTQTYARANQALIQLNQGAAFSDVAKAVSDDASTKGNGGSYPFAISRTSSSIAPQIVQQLFELQPGHHSSIINTGYSLEIVEVMSVQGNEIHAAHMSFNFQPITTYVQPLQDKYKPRLFIHT